MRSALHVFTTESERFSEEPRAALRRPSYSASLPHFFYHCIPHHLFWHDTGLYSWQLTMSVVPAVGRVLLALVSVCSRKVNVGMSIGILFMVTR
jgi:hypothetical protein